MSKLDPYLNLAAESDPTLAQAEIFIDASDGTFAFMDEEEQEFRRQPYNRIKQKIEHINRLVDKIKYANHSDDTRRTLYEHKRILEENREDFLGVGDLEH